MFSKVAVTRLASLISCSEYGLTETELLEILMPTSNSEAVISDKSGNFNFSSLCSIRRKMRRCIYLVGINYLLIKSPQNCCSVRRW